MTVNRTIKDLDRKRHIAELQLLSQNKFDSVLEEAVRESTGAVHDSHRVNWKSVNCNGQSRVY